jgi:hypothetical protein
MVRDNQDVGTFDDAQRALETRDKLRGSFEIAGDTYPIELREPTLGELEDIDSRLSSGADESEAIREIVDEFLIAPEIDPDTIGVGKLRSLFVGMRETWMESDDIDAATAEMPLEEGNSRQRSRR